MEQNLLVNVQYNHGHRTSEVNPTGGQYYCVLNSQTRLTINTVEKIPGVLLNVAIDIV